MGAVFLSIIAKEQLEHVYDGKPHPVALDLISPVVLFIVLASTLVHGTTIPLFKIGKRIRTRTLSITSTGSNQVLRLPKIQFGQQLGGRFKNNGSSNDKDYKEDDRRSRHSYQDTMTELQRNTLMNTIQQERFDHKDASSPLHEVIPMHAHSAPNIYENGSQSSPSTSQQTTAEDDDDLAEEDFLPGGEDEEEEHSTPTTVPTTAAHESQSIRFLEPVNPRMTTTSTPSSSRHRHSDSANIEKNEISASSFKNWFNKHAPHHHKTNKDMEGTDITSATVNVLDTSPQPTQSHEKEEEDKAKGLKHLFDHQHQPPQRHLSQEFLSTSDEVNVWDETDHIIIEDSQGQFDPITVVKSKDNPRWKQDVQSAIISLEKNIQKKKQDEDDIEEKEK